MTPTSSAATPPVVLTRTIELPNSGQHAVVVSLNRPDRLNCFNIEVVTQLSSAFRQIAQRTSLAQRDRDGDDDTIAAVIFTGEGRSFCAGADLSDPPSPIDQASDLPHHLYNNPVYQMSKVGVPIIGALKGHVITGGFELALACDILVGDKSTTFRDTHVKFGLAPCWGLSQKLQRKVGPGRAKLISLTARKVTALQAYEWGLLDLVASGESMSSFDRAMQVADEIAANDATMVQRYKRAIEEGGATDLAKGLQRERELGIAHYIEAVGDGKTFQSAKKFIGDESRPRSKL